MTDIIIKDRDIINLIKYWKKELGITRKITWIKDYDIYKCLVPNSKRSEIAAEIEDDCDVLWIDMELHKKKPISYLINSIVHELLHLNFGEKMSERQVQLETKRILEFHGVNEI